MATPSRVFEDHIAGGERGRYAIRAVIEAIHTASWGGLKRLLGDMYSIPSVLVLESNVLA